MKIRGGALLLRTVISALGGPQLTLMALLAAAGGGGGGPTPRISAARTATPPTIDGRLDDAVWTAAAVSDAFTQKFPDEGAAPSERTTVRVLYDDEALYVGVDCPQKNTPVLRRLTRRDRDVEADRITVDVGSRRDGISAFHFGVSASGVLSDGIHFNDTDFTSDWDENWEAETSADGAGWRVELRIPLRVLRFEALPTQDWGFNVRRFITLRQEIAEWSFIARTEAGVVSRFGHLDNLVGLQPRRDLELRPFGVVKGTRFGRGYGPVDGLDQGVTAGLDAKWHVTQDTTLDATFNPDFGQVEADQVVLNLGTIETFYPEKRPFFLEGADVFLTPKEVLYTRRIGRPPPDVNLLPGESLASLPSPSPIYGAAKLVGRPTERLTLGAISAVTGRNHVRVRRPDGVTEDRVMAPLTTYQVLRLKGALGDNGHLGVIATALNRFERAGDYPAADATGAAVQCPNEAKIAPGRRCLHDAYVAALDWRWRSPSGNYSLSGMALGSLVAYGPPRTFPDGTVIRAGDKDKELNLTVGKDGGRHWLWNASTNMTGAKFDRNELGFMRRQNDWWLSGDVIYRTVDPWWWTLETRSKVELRHGINLDGLPLARDIQLNTEWKLASFWTIFVEAHYRGAHYEDREVGDGTALERAALWGLEVEGSTDPRSRVVASLETTTQLIANGFLFRAEAGLTLRALPQLDLEILPEALTTFGEPRYAGEGAMSDERVFGALRATSIGATVRATYTFTPRLTLQAYVQFFVAAQHYSDFRSFTSTAAKPRIRLRDLAPSARPPENPDEQEGVLNASLLLRWEYRLGSTLYLVYTRSHDPDAPLMPGDRARLDPSAVPRGPAADALLLKISYWWG